MDPILKDEKTIQDKVNDVVEMVNVRDENWDEEDVAYMREVYGHTMEILSKVEPVTEEAQTSLEAVKTFLNWDTYNVNEADEIVENSTDIGSSTDFRLAIIEEYRNNSIAMLERLTQLFPRDLHTRLGLKKKVLTEVIDDGNLYEKGRRFLELIRG